MTILRLSNHDYHAADGVSKTTLSLFKKSPAMVEWAKNCPQDDEVTSASIFGDATHAILLEPERFAAEYVVEAKFDRRTTKGKEAAEEFAAAHRGKTIISADDGRKLELIRGSAMAHPTVRWLLEADGEVEESVFWYDPITGQKCKYRSDKRLTGHPVLIDVKSCDSIDRFANAIEDFTYYLQDGMYSTGYEAEFGEAPGFIFIAVQTTKELNRYPVTVFELIPEDRQSGKDEFRRLLDQYHEASIAKSFNGIQSIQRPYWAKR